VVGQYSMCSLIFAIFTASVGTSGAATLMIWLLLSCLRIRGWCGWRLREASFGNGIGQMVASIACCPVTRRSFRPGPPKLYRTGALRETGDQCP
jgi:hypothetical protein